MTNSDRKNIIQEVADSYVDRSLFSGIEWIAEKSGEIILSGKSGYQNFENKTPIPDDAVYRIYSMTKPITAVLALKLIERGDLHLYDPVSKFIPSFNDLMVLNPDGSMDPLSRPIIIEDLMTHRSGLSYDFLLGCHVAPLYAENNISDDKSRSLEEVCEVLSNLPLAYQPGQKFNYSVSLDVLARIMEIIKEKDFLKILREEIFIPLEMNDTGFGVKNNNLKKLMSIYGSKHFKDIMDLKPHSLIETDVSMSNPHDKEETFRRGGTGLFSTMKDFLSFSRMLLTGKSHTGEVILSKNMINFMKMNRLKKSQLPLFPGAPTYYGYGFNLIGRVVVDQGQVMSLTGKNEFGWGGASSCYFWVDPDEDLVGIMMTQYIGSMWPITDDIRTAIYQAID